MVYVADPALAAEVLCHSSVFDKPSLMYTTGDMVSHLPQLWVEMFSANVSSLIRFNAILHTHLGPPLL
jgi:hypothetical protein